MTILERIQILCKKKGTNPSNLEAELNFGKGSIYKWEKSSPSIDKLQKVSDYFNVSVDYLLYGFEKQRLAQLVEAAMFGRTIEQFSKDTGIEEGYLYKLCEGSIPNPPTVEVIKKIMSAPDSHLISDYYEMMQAAGHMDKETTICLKKQATLSAHRTSSYDDPLTEDEATAVDAFLKTYRGMKQNKKD